MLMSATLPGDREITDREHRERLKAWCRAQMDDGDCQETCRLRRWNRTAAQRHVDLALVHLFLVMVHLFLVMVHRESSTATR